MFSRSSQSHVTQIIAQLCEIPYNYTSKAEALKQITRLGMQMLRSHTCSIVLVDFEKRVLTQIACASSNPQMERLLQDQVVHFGSGQPGDWLKLERLKPDQIEKVYNLDVDGRGVANPKTARAYGITSMLSCPLMMNGQHIGRFNSFSTRRNHFTKVQERLIQILARVTIITLERFDHLQTRDRTLAILSRLSDSLLAIEHQRFLQLIADNACELLSVPVCIVWRVDQDARKLKVSAASAGVDEKFRNLEMSLDEPGIKQRLGPKISYVPDINQVDDIVNSEEIKQRKWVSLLCASLRVLDEPMGLLDVFTNEERQFTLWDKENFESFAQHAALSLRIADLLEKAEGREKLELLSQSMLDLTYAQSIEELRDRFLDGALRLVKARNGLIRRLDYASGTTKVVNWSKDPPPKLIELKLEEGITGLALKEEKPIRVSELRDPEIASRHVAAWEKEMRSELAIPIILNNAGILIGQTSKAGSKPIGVLNIESEDPGHFNEFDETCLWSLSKYAAAMIERLETDKKLTAIEGIESEIKETSNYDDVIDILMRGVTQTLGYEYANISMVVPDLNQIKSKHVEGISKDQKERFKTLAVHDLGSNAIEAEVVRTGDVIVPRAEDELRNGRLIKEFHLDLFSRVYLPIVEPSRNEVIGTLEVGYKKKFRPFIYERDVTNLKRLVGYAAQALQRRRSGLLDNLSHELRTPIIGIRNNASFLQHRWGKLEQSKRDAKFNDILADCQILLYQAAELEYVLGLRSRTRSNFEKTLVHRDIVIKTIYQLRQVVESRGLDPEKMGYRKEDAGRILISTDRAKLNQVVYNLLINAIKYAGKDPKTFTVKVEVDENRDSFILKFKDWGIGIKKEYAHKVFDDGFRTPEARAIDVTGSGLGLTLSKLIMNQLGGDLKLVNNYGPTEFHLILPKQQRSAPQ